MNTPIPRAIAKLVFFLVVVLCTPVQAYAADTLGELRLFLSEEQRSKLDALRRNPVKKEIPQPVSNPKPKPKPVVKKVVKAKPPPEMPEVKLQGFVRRSSGENTVWINDRATSESETIGQQLQLLSMDNETGGVSIKMPDQSKINLKPGQEFQPKGRKIVDVTE